MKVCDAQVARYYVRTWRAIVKKDPHTPWKELGADAKATWRKWYLMEKGTHA